MKALRIIIAVACFQCTPAKATTNLLMVLWNSIGVTPSQITNWTTIQTLQFPDANWGLLNLSQSGWTSYMLDQDLFETVFFRRVSGSNVVSIMEGGNSILFGSNAVQAYVDFTNLCWHVHTNGNVVIAHTCPKRTGYNTTQSNYVESFNALVRSNYTTFGVDYLNDLATNVLFDPYLNPGNFADGTHPNYPNGDVVLANQVQLSFPIPPPPPRYLGARR